MFTKVKVAQLCAAILVSAFFSITTNLNAQSTIGMQLLIPVEARIDSNTVQIRSPFADQESIKEEIYTESHYIKRDKIRTMTDDINRETNGEARKEKVVLIVHYL